MIIIKKRKIMKKMKRMTIQEKKEEKGFLSFLMAKEQKPSIKRST
jgi:hypothetical protein